MQDSTLLRIALVCGLVGVLVLFIITRGMEVEVQPIEQLGLTQDKEVAIRGTVADVTQRKSLTILEVGYETSIEVVLFDQPEVEVGDMVIVTGELREYKGEPEIVGNKLVIQ
jgi:RecJ-like exonuclease